MLRGSHSDLVSVDDYLTFCISAKLNERPKTLPSRRWQNHQMTLQSRYASRPEKSRLLVSRFDNSLGAKPRGYYVLEPSSADLR